MTGWGKDAFVGGNYQHVLKEVEVPVIPDGVCENNLRRTRLGPGFALHQGFLCAGGEEGKDACKVIRKPDYQPLTTSKIKTSEISKFLQDVDKSMTKILSQAPSCSIIKIYTLRATAAAPWSAK